MRGRGAGLTRVTVMVCAGADRSLGVDGEHDHPEDVTALGHLKHCKALTRLTIE